MKALILASALALLVTPALAVPFCNQPVTSHGMVDYGFGLMSEGDAAKQFEILLRGQGIDGHDTRFWNGCIQTFVKNDETGKDEMRFFNPDTLSEVPVN